MAKRTITTYELTRDGETFPVTFDPIEGTEVIQTSGDTAIVGYLSDDDSGSCGGWYFDENDSGKFYGFDNRAKGYDPKSRDEVAELAKANPGRAFWIHKYEHGLSRYYRAGKAITEAVELRDTEPGQSGLHIPDQQWDVSRGAALFIVPDDATEPEQYCDAVMEEFSNWCNGAIYGVVVERYTRAGDEWESDGNPDACWGHIGYEWAQQALKDQMPEVQA